MFKYNSTIRKNQTFYSSKLDNKFHSLKQNKTNDKFLSILTNYIEAWRVKILIIMTFIRSLNTSRTCGIVFWVALHVGQGS